MVTIRIPKPDDLGRVSISVSKGWNRGPFTAILSRQMLLQGTLGGCAPVGAG